MYQLHPVCYQKYPWCLDPLSLSVRNHVSVYLHNKSKHNKCKIN